MNSIRSLFSTQRQIDRRIERVIDYAATEQERLVSEIQEYEDHPVVEFKTSILDIDVDEAELLPHKEFKATGKSLYILNLAAEATLTNGYRYIKELLMQHHNFYLNNSYK